MRPSQKAYGGKKKIAWYEVYAGEKAIEASSTTGSPTATVEAYRKYLVGIKGPLTTPIGKGIRSLNVALRQHARSLRVPAPGALVHGRALAGQSTRATSTW